MESKRTSLTSTHVDEHDFVLDSDSDDGLNIRSSIETKSHGNGSLRPVPFKRADEPPYSIGRRLSFLDQDATTAQPEIPQASKEAPVTWRSLPHRRQLMILTIARLSEPLVQTSLQVRIGILKKSEHPYLLLLMVLVLHVLSTEIIRYQFVRRGNSRTGWYAVCEFHSRTVRHSYGLGKSG